MLSLVALIGMCSLADMQCFVGAPEPKWKEGGRLAEELQPGCILLLT